MKLGIVIIMHYAKNNSIFFGLNKITLILMLASEAEKIQKPYIQILFLFEISKLIRLF